MYLQTKKSQTREDFFWNKWECVQGYTYLCNPRSNSEHGKLDLNLL